MDDKQKSKHMEVSAQTAIVLDRCHAMFAYADKLEADGKLEYARTLRFAAFQIAMVGHSIGVVDDNIYRKALNHEAF